MTIIIIIIILTTCLNRKIEDTLKKNTIYYR